jgi:hypothetical protein
MKWTGAKEYQDHRTTALSMALTRPLYLCGRPTWITGLEDSVQAISPHHKAIEQAEALSREWAA